LRDLDHALAEREGVDGVMLGRAAYQTPATLMDVDVRVFGAHAPNDSRVAAVDAHIPYIERSLAVGVPLHAMTRHMLGLFNAQPGGRLWRRVLSEQGVRAGAGVEVVRAALAEVTQAHVRAA
jgi:tRNA-dihydrouridine synthase A